MGLSIDPVSLVINSAIEGSQLVNTHIRPLVADDFSLSLIVSCLQNVRLELLESALKVSTAW